MEGDRRPADTLQERVISIHSLRMEGDPPDCYNNPVLGISIHSLRMEGDTVLSQSWFASFPISIHSLRMEGDCLDRVVSKNVMLFQSTPSAWRETTRCLCFSAINFISIHSLRMEGDRILLQPTLQLHYISIHSLRMEGDVADRKCHTLHPIISIHSLRMKGDYHRMCYIRRLWDFNPLPPHGGRLA